MGWCALDEHRAESNVDIASGEEEKGKGIDEESESKPKDELGLKGIRFKVDKR